MIRHPAHEEHAEQLGTQRRAAVWFLRRFFSPTCFYLHIAVYLVWMLAIEQSPWQRFLTYISIEAILVALLIGIGQQALADQQALVADHDHQILTCLHRSPQTGPCTCTQPTTEGAS